MSTCDASVNNLDSSVIARAARACRSEAKPFIGLQVALLFSIAVVFLFGAGFSKADEVIIRNPQGKEFRRRGTIVEYKGGVLTIDSGGRETKIPHDRIYRYQSEWSAQHVEANEQFASHHYAEAALSFRKTLLEEKRQWVQRLLLSRLIQCQANTKRVDQACKNFAALVRNDPKTHLLKAMPLAWSNEVTPSAVQQRVEPWLDNAQRPTLQLLAASWLFNGNNRDSSVSILKQLGRSENTSIANLAISQLWRAELVNLKRPRLEFWKQHVQKVPIELRAGPYYLLGQSFAKHDMVDEASFAFLRLPSQYPHELQLVADAVANCSKLLRRAKRLDEEQACYRLLVAEYPQQEFTKRVKALLDTSDSSPNVP